ncbi:MAG: rhodanese-like domain-containing protein [Cyanobacteria bacterium P01_H01_bin.74]
MPAFENIDNSTLEALLKQKDPPVLIDVRTPEEWAYLGHIPQAQLMPLHTLSGKLSTLSKTQPVVIVCEHGVRSADASAYLCQNGFSSVSHLQDGMAHWPGEREFGP